MNGIRLTLSQRRSLRRQLKETRDARVYRRTLALLEHAQGTPVTKVAESLGVDRRSVHRWIESFVQSSDPSSLCERPRPGRPRLWSPDCARRLEELLKVSPESLGFFAVNWTVPLLRESLVESMGQLFSDDTIRRGLWDLGYVWKRPRYVLAPDPEREKKKISPSENQGIAAPKCSAGRG
jgi:transposase